MISPYCVANECESCGKRIRRQNGKVYRCKCPCHPIPVKVEKPIEEDEDEYE